jgi:hypothetical protein
MRRDSSGTNIYGDSTCHHLVMSVTADLDRLQVLSDHLLNESLRVIV